MSLNEQIKNGSIFPNITAGYVLAIVAFSGAIYVELIFRPSPGQAGAALAALMTISAFVLPAAIYWLICLYKIHGVLMQTTAGEYPISPVRAIASDFLPLYNIYWKFKWPSEVADFVNHAKGAEAMNRWAPGCFLLLAFLTGRGALFGVAVFIEFVVLAYLISKIKLAAESVELPIRGYLEKTGKSKVTIGTGWLVAIGIFLTLMAAMIVVAIPNFTKAREQARVAAAQNQGVPSQSLPGAPNV